MKNILKIFIFLFLSSNLYSKDIVYNDFFYDYNKIEQSYIEKNYVKFDYSNLKDKNINFSIILPKKWELESNNKDNIEDYKNKSLMNLIRSYKKFNQYINFYVSAFYSDKEYNSRDIAQFACEKMFNCKIILDNSKYDYDGINADFIATNKEKNIIKIKSERRGDVYYIIFVIVKDKDIFIENNNEISIFMNSFKNINKISLQYNSVKFNFLKKIFVFAAPQNWKVQKIKEEDNNINIQLLSNNLSSIDIIATKNLNKNIKYEFLQYYFKELINNHFVLDKITNKNIVENKNGEIVVKIKMEKENKKYNLYVKIFEKYDVIFLINIIQPINENFLIESENKRVINLIIETLKEL